MKKYLLNKIYTILLIIVFLVIWYSLYRTNIFSGKLSNPIDVFTYFLSLSNLGTLFSHLLNTLFTFLISLLIGISFGYFLGIISGVNETLRHFLYPTFNALKSIPITAFISLFLIVFHLSYFVIPLIAFPLISIVASNISDACCQVNKSRESVIKMYKVSFLDQFRNIIYWETLEVFFATLRVVISYTLALEIAIDFFLNVDQGLGYLISSSYYSYAYTQMYASIIIIGLLGIILIKILDHFSKELLEWKRMQ